MISKNIAQKSDKALTKLHADIDVKIQAMQKQPASDAVALKRLKAQKLRCKDELARRGQLNRQKSSVA